MASTCGCGVVCALARGCVCVRMAVLPLAPRPPFVRAPCMVARRGPCPPGCSRPLAPCACRARSLISHLSCAVRIVKQEALRSRWITRNVEQHRRSFAPTKIPDEMPLWIRGGTNGSGYVDESNGRVCPPPHAVARRPLTAVRAPPCADCDANWPRRQGSTTSAINYNTTNTRVSTDYQPNVNVSPIFCVFLPECGAAHCCLV